MAIDLTELFTRLRKMFDAADGLLDASGPSLSANIKLFSDLFDQESMPIHGSTDGLQSAVDTMARNARSFLGGSITRNMSTLIIESVAAESEQTPKRIDNAIDWLIDEFDRQSETLQESTLSSSVSFGAGNEGEGAIEVSLRRVDGKVSEFVYGEDVQLEVSSVNNDGSVTWTISGERTREELDPFWPDGSGASISLTSRVATGGNNRLVNADFEDENAQADDLPLEWQAAVATLGTTLKMTPIEVQTVTISGSPTEGFYRLRFEDRNSKTHETSPIAWDGDQSAVEAALQALPGLGAVAVETTGTSPNFTHTITFNGVPDPNQLTSVNDLDTGSIGHATTTAGSANVIRGARAVEFDADGAQLTELSQEVNLEPSLSYAACVPAIVDVVPAAGVIEVALVDGVGGSVIQDDEGNANSFTIDATSLSNSDWTYSTGSFRTPKTLPGRVYFRIKQTTAVSSGTSVFVDEVALSPATRLYPGGPYVAIFPGLDNFEMGDTAEIDNSNGRQGVLHEWMNRFFRLRQTDRLFPVSSSPTIPDDVGDSSSS